MPNIHRYHRRSNLYYVESVTRINAPDRNHNQAIAILQYVPIDIQRWVDLSQDFKWYKRAFVSLTDTELVREGKYVYHSENQGFRDADNDERVIKIKRRSEELLTESETLGNYELKLPEPHNVGMLYSYHLNVGHGNLSLLVFECDRKKHIWMIDGSDYDFLLHRNYTALIQKLFVYLNDKFNITTPHIDVLMITHAHYDHYSGITHFIQNGLIDSQTLVYLNTAKKIASHNFNNLLNTLRTNRIPVIPPFVHNSTQNINIIYPDSKTFSHALKINNTSSVYCIQFDGVNYIIFPGDLETEGWDLVDNHQCCPYMRKTKYYAISHHGSLNGHLRSKCNFRSIASACDCLPQSTKTILMGRDKAFSGIYSNRVLLDFNGRLFCSEKDNNGLNAAFLEIDLIAGVESWHY